MKKLLTVIAVSTLTYFILDFFKQRSYNQARIAAGESKYERIKSNRFIH